MNSKHWFALLIAAGLVACTKTETETVTIQSPDQPEKIEIEYTYKEKPQLVEKMKAQSSELKAQLKELGDKMSNSTAEARARLEPKMESLKERSKNLDLQIDKVESATEATWNEVKTSARSAYEDAKQGFHDARDWLVEKLK